MPVDVGELAVEADGDPGHGGPPVPGVPVETLVQAALGGCRWCGHRSILPGSGSDRGSGILGDDVLATAILDRLLHHGDVLSINGPSYRLEDPSTSSPEVNHCHDPHANTDT